MNSYLHAKNALTPRPGKPLRHASPLTNRMVLPCPTCESVHGVGAATAPNRPNGGSLPPSHTTKRAPTSKAFEKRESLDEHDATEGAEDGELDCPASLQGCGFKLRDELYAIDRTRSGPTRGYADKNSKAVKN